MKLKNVILIYITICFNFKFLFRYSQAHMYMAKLTMNRRITAPDWEQDVRHIELDISSGGANRIRLLLFYY